MIRIEIAPDVGTGYVLRVKDGANGRILLSSTSQSYANPEDAEKIARRLFGPTSTDSRYMPSDDIANVVNSDREAVELVISYRNGTSSVELIR